MRSITCAWNVRRPPELVFALAQPDDAQPDDAQPDDAQPDDAQPDDAQPDDAIAHVRLRGVTGASARSRAGTLEAYSHSDAAAVAAAPE